jgi:hypothetical protein
MDGPYRLILNFANDMEAGTLWRLCASSRLANHRSVFHGIGLCLSRCQPFQENVNKTRNDVNKTRNDVNDVGKPVNLFRKLTVNHIRK